MIENFFMTKLSWISQLSLLKMHFANHGIYGGHSNEVTAEYEYSTNIMYISSEILSS